MKAYRHCAMLALVAFAGVLLGGCDDHHDGTPAPTTSSAALEAVEKTANVNPCDSFAPSQVNGQTFPQDSANEVPSAINGAPSPLNCTSGM